MQVGPGEELGFVVIKNVIALRVRIARGLAVSVTAVAKLVRLLGVDKFEISEVSIEQVSSGECGLQGYKAWVRLEFCRGQMVIDMDTQCRSSQLEPYLRTNTNMLMCYGIRRSDGTTWGISVQARAVINLEMGNVS